MTRIKRQATSDKRHDSKKTLRVAVGLSGGVDSAVSAALLKEQRYDVTGVFLICYNGPGCRTDEDRKDALDVALRLEIPFEVLDFRQTYQEKVLHYFKDEYKAGRTPNPDVVCNREIKFGLFYEWAMKQGFGYVATGHYARIRRIREMPNAKFQMPNKFQKSNNTQLTYQLVRSVDEHKDQTYFLYQLRKEQLEHILFPVGGMTKAEVRTKAKELGLAVAEKKDSVGICFVGEVSVGEFLRSMGVKDKRGGVFTKIPKSKNQNPNKLQNPITTQNSSLVQIGEHKGVWSYTVGQRVRKLQVTSDTLHDKYNKNMQLAGFDLTNLPPLYVIEKDVKKNRLIVGTREKCYRDGFEAGEIHLISPDDGLQMSDEGWVQVRIRHGGKLINVKLRMLNAKRNMMQVILEEPVFGVAPGQACVFYRDKVCLGGGVIQ